jgi:hypothetical protein
VTPKEKAPAGEQGCWAFTAGMGKLLGTVV